MNGDMRFDRSVSDELLDMLRHGAARGLVDRAQDQGDEPLYDLQLRREPKGTRSWATLYFGMTALINLHEHKGEYKLTADESYMAHRSFDTAWTTKQPREAIESAWPRVEAYLDDIKGDVASSATSKEGPVHAAIGSWNSDAYRVIQREARPSFKDKATRDRRLADWVAPFNRALAQRQDPPKWWPKNVKVGSSLDFLAVDIGGRLALVEAKADAATARELAKVAVQAGVYAAMFADLLRENRDEAFTAVSTMLQQRTSLGLSRKGVLHLRDKGQVVPVIAIGPGRPTPEVHRRMWEVAQAVSGVRDENVDPIEVWYLDRAGHITEVERWGDVRRAEEGR